MTTILTLRDIAFLIGQLVHPRIILINSVQVKIYFYCLKCLKTHLRKNISQKKTFCFSVNYNKNDSQVNYNNWQICCSATYWYAQCTSSCIEEGNCYQYKKRVFKTEISLLCITDFLFFDIFLHSNLNNL